MIITNDGAADVDLRPSTQTARNTGISQTLSSSSDLAATSSFTLMVFDMSSGKITCSLVSKDRGISPDNSSINTTDAVSYLTEEVAKLASKKIVSAGLFNVWKGLFKWNQCWLDIIKNYDIFLPNVRNLSKSIVR